MYISLVDLARVTKADDENAILEYRWPNITSMKDFLSSSIPRHMTSTGARVAVIQDSFGFQECQTTAENRVSTDPI